MSLVKIQNISNNIMDAIDCLEIQIFNQIMYPHMGGEVKPLEYQTNAGSSGESGHDEEGTGRIFCCKSSVHKCYVLHFVRRLSQIRNDMKRGGTKC